MNTDFCSVYSVSSVDYLFHTDNTEVRKRTGMRSAIVINNLSRIGELANLFYGVGVQKYHSTDMSSTVLKNSV